MLEKHFLPVVPSPTGIYGARQRDLARAFVLLAHAEIESFFEERARDKVNTAFVKWKTKNACTELMSRLLIYHCAKVTKEQIQPSEEAINKAVNFYISELKQNHGIREHNVLTILMPIGLMHSDLDATLLGTLDSFGSFRGDLAHRSIKAHQAIDPKTESDKIRKLLPDLSKLDQKISRLR